MSDEMVTETVEVAGAALSIADIMGYDTSDVAEVRRVKFPKGLYLWEISRDAKIEARDNSKTEEKQFVINVPLICVGVVSGGEDCAKFPGKAYFENFWIKNDDPEETIGQFKAFAKDVGYEGSAVLQDIIDGIKRMRFLGGITHNRNKDNPDDPYANLQRDKLRPASAEEVAQYQTYQVPEQEAA